MSHQHFSTFADFSVTQLQALAERALEIKSGSAVLKLRGKQFVTFFFNPSLRTRVSFEVACAKYGAHCVSLAPGADTWQFESRIGVRMDGGCAEHLKEAVHVVSRYGDALAVRSFARLQNLADDAREEVLTAFRRYATVPVINLESPMEHPCQAIADMATLKEKFAAKKRTRFVLSWAPHIKPLPLAVPHSALLAGVSMGLDVTVCHPPGYELHSSYLTLAARIAESSGATLSYTNDQREAFRDADVVYVKSWGAPALYGDVAAQTASFEQRGDWMVRASNLRPQTKVMHCLPVRRNVVIADDVLDSEQAIVIDQAENRLWAQAAILEQVIS